MLDRLIDGGIKFLFVSNSDNLGATLDLDLLEYFANSGKDFMMEVSAFVLLDSDCLLAIPHNHPPQGLLPTQFLPMDSAVQEIHHSRDFQALIRRWCLFTHSLGHASSPSTLNHLQFQPCVLLRHKAASVCKLGIWCIMLRGILRMSCRAFPTVGSRADRVRQEGWASCTAKK